MAKPGTRRVAREVVLQYLFSSELNREYGRQPRSVDAGDEEDGAAHKPDFPPAGSGDFDPEAFWKLRPARSGERAFAEELIAGIEAQREAIDQVITRAADNYAFHRISAVDRNILRLATHEILHRDDIPPAVSINEAVEIAKRFGTEDSAKFVNGVLDRIARDAAAG